MLRVVEEGMNRKDRASRTERGEMIEEKRIEKIEEKRIKGITKRSARWRRSIGTTATMSREKRRCLCLSQEMCERSVTTSPEER
jgi:hypothetical protein